MKLFFYLLSLYVFVFSPLYSQSIVLHKFDSVVWGAEQEIEGRLMGFFVPDGLLYVNNNPEPFTVNAADSSFTATVTLHAKSNYIIAMADDNGSVVSSDTLRLTLGYVIRPEVYLSAEVEGRSVSLIAKVLDNPLDLALTFEWSEDDGNPATVGLPSVAETVVQVTFPEDTPEGEYYFSVSVSGSETYSTEARTFVTVDSTGIKPFDIQNDYAEWIDHAVVYQVTPYIFVFQGRFHHITSKIPELAELGINTLWLQPVFETYERGQGYGITNYFKVRPDLGTEADLRTLVETAHAHGMRVLFDFVPNHSSIHHPYAQETIEHGESSHYYNFYQREFDTVPYSQHYNAHQQGFVYYFWTDLPNLNYHNPEVKRWITEAGRYWIEEFDIDGYRIDAVWGVNARNPEFMQEWRLALKRVKPEIMLLGEDKATWPMVFDERFDVAYDWAASEAWVSQWVWQTFYSSNSNPTIFNNSNQNTRADLLRNSLTNNGNGYHPDAKILRFMENNDTFRFIATHDLARTKMVAALIFSLHGIPLVYNGQEIGATSHPYGTSSIFSASNTIRSMSQFGLFDYYQHLIRIRGMFPALRTNNFEELPATPSNTVYAFRRWSEKQNIFTVINMGSSGAQVQMQLPTLTLGLDDEERYYLTDLVTGEYFEGTPSELTDFSVDVPGFTSRMFVLADEVVITSVPDESIVEMPVTFEVLQNYPNPFNPATTIAFTLPAAGPVTLRVYDMLGRVVATLADDERPAGTHTVHFEAAYLASGTYFYRVEFGGHSVTKRMVLLK
jgi:cyclomaltodextrinase / maltogenic alpha-amylase / neopullulanase